MRDDIRVTVLALRNKRYKIKSQEKFEFDHPRDDDSDMLSQSTPETLVIVSANIYMLFKNDLNAYYDLIKGAVGSSEFEKIEFLVAATHLHEGPDTAGLDEAVK